MWRRRNQGKEGDIRRNRMQRTTVAITAVITRAVEAIISWRKQIWRRELYGRERTLSLRNI
eukprot:9223566-Heterocapsa_arctica.AAC.1